MILMFNCTLSQCEKFSIKVSQILWNRLIAIYVKKKQRKSLRKKRAFLFNQNIEKELLIKTQV